MSERELQQNQADWDIPAAVRALFADVEQCQDMLCGEGHRLLFQETAPTTPTELELFPVRQVVKFRNPYLNLEMANVISLTVFPPEPHKLSWLRAEARDQHTRSVLFVDPAGSVIFGVDPIGQPGEESQLRPTSESPAPQAEPLSALPTSPDKPARVLLTGTIGRDPELRNTPKGRQVTRIPLAVHEGETTTWHTVLFFDDKAKKAAETLSKGQIVSVVGYRHQREVVSKTGIKKQVEEIYAAAVQTPKENRP